MSVAFWISPKGQFFEVEAGNHISTVLKYPEKFGYTKEGIFNLFKSYNEPLGQEGKARDQILKDCVERGWVRLRSYPNRFWSITVFDLNKKTKDWLWDWANKLIEGKLDVRGVDQYFPVKILCLRTGRVVESTVIDISRDTLYNLLEMKQNEFRYRLIL